MLGSRPKYEYYINLKKTFKPKLNTIKPKISRDLSRKNTKCKCKCRRIRSSTKVLRGVR